VKRALIGRPVADPRCERGDGFYVVVEDVGSFPKEDVEGVEIAGKIRGERLDGGFGQLSSYCAKDLGEVNSSSVGKVVC